MMNGAETHGNLLRAKEAGKVSRITCVPVPNLIKLQVESSLRWTFAFILITTKTMLRRITLNQIETIMKFHLNTSAMSFTHELSAIQLHFPHVAGIVNQLNHDKVLWSAENFRERQ